MILCALAVVAIFAVGAATAMQSAPAPAVPAASEPAAQPRPEIAETEIVLTDGRRITGELVSQSDETVVLKVAGIDTPFARSSISRLRTLPSIEEQYRNLRSRLKDSDLLERLQIAEWLRQKERFDLSLAEIEGVLILDPGSPQAKDLRTQVLLEQALAQRRVDSTKDRKAEPRQRPGKPKPPEFPLLTMEQVNLIKVFEVDLRGNPRLAISSEIINKLLDTYAGKEGLPTTREGRDAFKRKPPKEILDIIFRLRARELYSGVTVTDHPPAMRAFRDDVHETWLLNSCATAACHAGPNAGRLYLADRGAPPDRMIYTNFLIIDRFRMKDGRPLIDPEHPAESPLLHMALPQDEAVFKHPEVVVGSSKVRWRAVFNGMGDPRFQRAVRWIEMLYRPRPDYPIDYAPPKLDTPETGR